MIFVGLDIGGSKSLCLVASSNQLLGRFEASGANLHQQGLRAATSHIVALVDRARATAGRDVQAQVAVCIAGLDTEASKRALLEALTLADPQVGWRAENDSLAAWKGAFGDGEAGVVAIAGTGAAAYARRSGHQARAGGWGALLGDEGSGYSLGRAALIAVLRQRDGSGPATSLAPALLQRLGAREAEEIIDLVHFRMTAFDIAALAPAVLDEAIKGDAEARRIVDEAALALVTTAKAAADAVSPDEGLPFAVVGGLACDGFYLDRLRSVAARWPNRLVWRRAQHSPLVGALRLAMEASGSDASRLNGLSDIA